MDLEGKRLGQYQVIEELGRGGMAIVYKAFQPSLNRYVAIKVLPQQFTFDNQFVQRFLREARSAAALHHPNIVTIHDVCHQDGHYFIVMEFVEGATLDQVVAESGRMPLPRIQRIVSQVVDALQHAHQRGLIHRDIKPTNIMVDPQRNDHVTLMDFGLVRAAEDSGLTKTGTIVGTPEYMSPEQAEGGEIDRRTDIYSLGVVLFKMLTGRVPFSKSTPHAVLIAHMTQEPPSISSISPGPPAPVEAVVRKALAKDREKRYSQVGDLGRDLAIAASGQMPPGLGRPTPPPAPASAAVQPTVVTQKPAAKARGKGWIWAVGGVAALLLVGACVVAALALDLLPFSASAAPTSTPALAPTSTLVPTREAADTATLAFTPSPTIEPSPTVEPSPSPSLLPSATPRATETSTLTPAPTATDLPAPTATSAATAQPTAVPQATTPPQATAPNLMAPSQGGTFKNPIGFQWGGSLGAGQSYQVTASHRSSGYVMQSGLLTAQSWTTSLPDDRVGEWVWSVAVVQDGAAGARSSEGMFWFDPFSGMGGGGGDGGGGDGGGDGKNTPAPP
ncbi:MAG: protein kinase [Anaerolineae bacterium]|jgi:serine/threonine-protein kinase